MKIIVTDGMGNNQIKKIESEKISGEELLKQLEISTFEAVIMKNGEIVRESEILNKEDHVKILNMIHGG